MDKIFDCIIIGGGPAGLMTAYQLAQKDIDYIILEKGELGQSWRDMHDSLKLLSPMWVNQLPGKSYPLLRRFKKISKNDFVQYLNSYSLQYELRYQTKTSIEKVSKTDSHFTIKTNRGLVLAKTIVNATGYFSNPYLPLDFPNDHSIKIIHSADYKSPKQIESLGISKDKKILIVGKRVSAGQLLPELFNAGFPISLSVQSKIETRISGIGAWIKENLYYIKEFLRFLFNPYIKADSRALMDGGETDQIINSGRINIHPSIKSITKGTVTFLDGSTAQYDLIIMATGYRPSIKHLYPLIDENVPLLSQINMGAHTQIKGLYFVGIDNMISFKSRYIRGIACDSKVIATKLIFDLQEKT